MSESQKPNDRVIACPECGEDADWSPRRREGVEWVGAYQCRIHPEHAGESSPGHPKPGTNS
jgi:hypothetical protein